MSIPLPTKQATIFATVMEDVLKKLHILNECNNGLRIYNTQSNMKTLCTTKFGVMPSNLTIESNEINTKNLYCTDYKLNKFTKDRNLCEQILTATYLELSLAKTYDSLVEYREAIQNQRKHELSLAENVARNKMYVRREVVRSLRHQRNRIVSTLYETKTAMERLNFEVQDEIFLKELKSRYINKWQDSRTEQNERWIKNEESGFSETITYYRKKMEDEQRVHAELELITNIEISDILKHVDEVMSKYDKNLEEMDYKIERMHIKFDEMVNKRLEMEKLFNHREEEIKNWIEFKHGRKVTRLYKENMIKSAIIVQAWWRGILVRLRLGPWRRSKKTQKK